MRRRRKGFDRRQLRIVSAAVDPPRGEQAGEGEAEGRLLAEAHDRLAAVLCGAPQQASRPGAAAQTLRAAWLLAGGERG